ncbi:MAG: sigma-70 family RNA polymerase sigma factor [Oscillospiraceae bacterium]|nr:sigma-70 family RNA polymerase sigma factor [Oscillospiraceae bacterium]
MFWQILQLLQRLSLLFRLHLCYGSFPRTLSAAEEREAFVRLKLGDRAARDLLISHNLRLVSHVAKKYHAGRHEPDDLVSIGSIGLIKAVDSFDPAQGTRFSTYAARCIENEILMQFRLDMKAKNDISMSEPLDVDDEGGPLTVSDVLCDDTDIAQLTEHAQDRAAMLAAVKRLPARESMVLRLRYALDGGAPLTQQQVAKRLGISRSYISRIEKHAIETLQKKLAQHM